MHNGTVRATDATGNAFDGSTNAVTPSTDGRYVVKRYRSVSRNEDAREWIALRMLQWYAAELAPRPVAYSAAEPSVTMTRMPGRSLRDQPLDPCCIDGIVTALEQMHTCVPRHELPRLLPAYVDDMFDRTRADLETPPVTVADSTVRAAWSEVREWFRSADAQRLRVEPEVPVLGRRDHNMANFLWDGDTIRLVDFEDSGVTDRAGEYAELVEHVSARATSDREWDRLLDAVDLTMAERRRLRAAR